MTKWPSPAKLNLFLQITGQRDDGYHELQTVFQFLDYCDYLQFEITKSPDIQLLTPIEGVDNDANLIVRAATLLQQHAQIQQGAKVTLDKKLPMGGGLGGGSSNAATTLVALNQLWDCQLNNDELAKLGLTLGADVPIFIYGYAAWAEGIGENLTPISPPEAWYAVIIPDCHVSTAEVFSSPELTRDCGSITMSRFLSGEGRNVCEDVVLKHYPPVAKVFDWLTKFAKPRMTGTGACVFASFNSKSQAQRVVDSLPEKWQGFVAKACNESPLTMMTSKRSQN